MSSSTELCCTVNPTSKCYECGKGLCTEHSKAARSTRDYIWCSTCSIAREDYIDLIQDATDHLTDALDEHDSVAGEWDNVVKHVQRCPSCRDETPCNELYCLIDTAAMVASASARRLRKLR